MFSLFQKIFNWPITFRLIKYKIKKQQAKTENIINPSDQLDRYIISSNSTGNLITDNIKTIIYKNQYDNDHNMKTMFCLFNKNDMI